MSLNGTALDIAISQRLEPLRQTLLATGIFIATLPKVVGEMTGEDVGALHIRIPTIAALPADRETSTPGYQDVSADISIGINLPKRYKEFENEVDVLEWIVDQVVFLLIGFAPENFKTLREIRFERYELFRPEHKMWLAELQFSYQYTIKGQITGASLEPLKPEVLESIELFAGRKLDFSDAQLTYKFK